MWKANVSISDRENYFWHARHFVRQAFSTLSDILLMNIKYQWSFLFYFTDILCVLNPARQNVRQGLSSLPDISRSLPDMSGIFRDHWSIRVLVFSHRQWLHSACFLKSQIQDIYWMIPWVNWKWIWTELYLLAFSSMRSDLASLDSASWSLLWTDFNSFCSESYFVCKLSDSSIFIICNENRENILRYFPNERQSFIHF